MSFRVDAKEKEQIEEMPLKEQQEEGEILQDSRTSLFGLSIRFEFIQ